MEAKLFESKVYALKNKGFIDDSDSDWSSPVISQIIKGVVEFSIDYAKLNKITKDFNYKIPDKSSLIDQITESCFFSRIVIKDAMKQLRLDTESSSKTAFTTGMWLLKIEILILILICSFVLQMEDFVINL